MRNDKEVSQAKVRPATIDDAKAILEVHYGAVHETADKDYPIEILSEWSPEVDEKRLTDFQKQLREGKDGEKLYVVELENQIAGFGAIVPANQELRAVYVSPMFARRSVGKLILEHLEKEYFELAKFFSKPRKRNTFELAVAFCTLPERVQKRHNKLATTPSGGFCARSRLHVATYLVSRA